jgi:hypothetical protein
MITFIEHSTNGREYKRNLVHIDSISVDKKEYTIHVDCEPSKLCEVTDTICFYANKVRPIEELHIAPLDKYQLIRNLGEKIVEERYNIRARHTHKDLFTGRLLKYLLTGRSTHYVIEKQRMKPPATLIDSPLFGSLSST